MKRTFAISEEDFWDFLRGILQFLIFCVYRDSWRRTQRLLSSYFSIVEKVFKGNTSFITDNYFLGMIINKVEVEYRICIGISPF